MCLTNPWADEKYANQMRNYILRNSKSLIVLAGKERRRRVSRWGGI